MATLELTRREWLGGLLGLGTGLGCARGAPGPRLRGAILGAHHKRGHKLREGLRPDVVRQEQAGVVIVGAGIAGLSAAWAFERAGFHDFVVLELDDAPGGTARSGTGSVTPFPWGAHYVPIPPTSHRPMVALLEEVGAVEGRDAAGRPVYAEHILCREPQERVFYRGEWYEGLYPLVGSSPEDLRQLEAFEQDMRRWTGWKDARGHRGFTAPRGLGSDAPEMRALDRASMADYLQDKGWTSERLRWYVEYACRDDFGASLQQTSAWAGIHYFASRLEDATSPSAEFLTWPEGNGRLVAHLAKVVGPRLRTGALVTEVSPGGRGVDVTYFDVQHERGVALHAEHCVFALPRFLAPHLIAPWREAPPAYLTEAIYSPWMVANLTLRDRPASRGFPLAWDNVLYDSPALGYVVATHQSTRDHGPTVFTYYDADISDDVHAARQRMLDTPWETWTTRILADLERAHPDLQELVEQVDVWLWGHAMVRPRPGFMWSGALSAWSRPLGRIHFAHTDLSGMALFEEAQYWGLRAAETILKQQGHRFGSWFD